MSRVIFRDTQPSDTKSLASLLPEVTAKKVPGNKDARLGKTAQMLANLRNEAFEEGLQQGIQEGREIGIAQAKAEVEKECSQYVSQFVDELNAIAEIVQKGMNQWYTLAEESLGGLALVIAAKVIAKEVESSPEVALEIAKEAIAEVTHAEKATIKVNPFSSAILRDHTAALTRISPSLKQIQIVEDPTILGGCVIESTGGRIDATVRTRVKSLVASVLEEYEAVEHREDVAA